MHFLDHPGLSRLSALLKELDVGDRILSGRLELFSTRVAPTKVELEPPNEVELLSRAGPYLDGAVTGNPTVKKQKVTTGEGRQQLLKDTGDDCSASGTSSPSGYTLDRRTVSSTEDDGDFSNCLHDDDEKKGFLSTSLPAFDKDLLDHNNLRKRSRALSASSSVGSEDLTPPERLEPGDYCKLAGRPRRSSSISSASSFLRAQTPEQARRLLVQLVTTLNACFPHYDFSSVGPDAFVYAEDFVSVYTAINYHLSFLAEVVIPGFLQDLWSVIKDAVDLREVSIYSYNNAQGQVESDPYLDDEGCLFSFDYFFVDAKHQKILFFSCMTKQKLPETSGDYWGEGYDSALSPTTSLSSIDECSKSYTRLRRDPNDSDSLSDFVIDDERKHEDEEDTDDD